MLQSRLLELFGERCSLGPPAVGRAVANQVMVEDDSVASGFELVRKLAAGLPEARAG